jgi:predicted permease
VRDGEWTSHLRPRLELLALSPERHAEVVEELSQHLDERYDELRREGVSDADARRLVLEELREPEALAAYMRPLRQSRVPPPIAPGAPRRAFVADLWQDIRYAARMLLKQPGFAAAAVLTIAAGIGANTAIFALADAVLLRPLPVERPHELVLLKQTREGAESFPFTSTAVEALSAPSDTLAGLATYRPLPNTQVAFNGSTHVVLLQAVSGNYHAVLGVRAAMGRTLSDQDRDPVVVISHRYWQQQFAADPAVLGRTLVMNGVTYAIVGVTPRGFFGTQPGRNVDITVPLVAQSIKLGPDARWLYLIGRLAPGLSMDQARASLQARWAQLAAASSTPARFFGTLELDSGAQGMNQLRRQFSMPLQILSAIVGVVLLVACANLAGLLIVRSNSRRQEIAVRLSLGASRARVLRQFLTESVVLAVLGGAAGVMVARWATDLLLVMMSRGRTPVALDVPFDARLFVFAAVITLATSILFGLLPALAASRTHAQGSLRSHGSDAGLGRPAWARSIVVVQIALLVVLLTAAGLFARTLHKLQLVDAGFRPQDVLVLNVSRPGTAPTFYEDLVARFAALPAVASVSHAMDAPPATEMSMTSSIAVPGRPAEGEQAPPVHFNFVSPGFFKTMGIELTAGRDFEERDAARLSNRVIVSENLARRYFRSEDPLGRDVLVRGQVATIVGVARNVRYTSLRAEAPMVAYLPAMPAAAHTRTFLIRTSGASTALAPLLQQEVRKARPGAPPATIQSVEDQVAGAMIEERMLAALSGAIGVLAAVLASVGIYATLAATVARRRREIGLRMALGARPGQVSSMIVREVALMCAAGLAIGIPAAIAAGRAAAGLLDRFLFELAPGDPLILTAASAAILGIALLAAYVPARRAARIDPLAAVKYE